MSLPTINDVGAVDPVLTNMLVGFKQDDSRFVAGRVFPSVPVKNDSGTYYTLTKKYWFLDGMEQRAAGSKFARNGFGVETATYATLGWGLENPIPDEVEANNQMPLTLESAGLQWLAQQSLIRKERAFSADFMLYSVWTSYDNDSATDWDDFQSGDPASNIKTGKRTISQLTGMAPNTLVVGEVVDDALTLHPDMIDRIKYVTMATAMGVSQAVASILGVPSYIVATAIYNSANEGQDPTLAAIIDDDALLCYVAPSPGIFTASAGYTFTWAGGGGDGEIVQYRDQSVKSNILQLSEQWDQKVVAADLGYFWAGIV